MNVITPPHPNEQKSNNSTRRLPSVCQLHHTTSSSCGWGDHCNHCNHSTKHNSNHLSVHQWIRSAIHTSQQLISPIVLSWKLPPPPCAILLVIWCNTLLCLMLLQCDRSSHTSGPKENILSHLSLIEEPCATWRHNQPYEVWNPIHPPGWLIWS